MAEEFDEERWPSGGDHVDVVALVLGDVDGRRRAEMAAHVLRCPTCRRDYDDAAAIVGDLLPAVPAVQPRARLRRARPATHAGPTGPPGPLAVAGGRGGRPDHRHRRGARLVGSSGTTASRRPATSPPSQLTNGGDPVGTVSLSDVDGEQVMVVAIYTAPDGVSYLCRTTFADGTTSESEAWPPGSGAWIVDLPASTTSPVETVELVVDGTDPSVVVRAAAVRASLRASESA